MGRIQKWALPHPRETNKGIGGGGIAEIGLNNVVSGVNPGVLGPAATVSFTRTITIQTANARVMALASISGTASDGDAPIIGTLHIGAGPDRTAIVFVPLRDDAEWAISLNATDGPFVLGTIVTVEIRAVVVDQTLTIPIGFAGLSLVELPII